uniref:energy transducer TonB n=1 Tax=Fulvivirga sp. TaxID=1931237 RepID=UPI00404B5077
MGHPETTENIFSLRVAQEKRGIVRSIEKKPWENSDFVGDLISIKRARRTNAVSNKKLFFSIGLFLSMIFITTMFEWRSYENTSMINLEGNIQAMEEIMDVPLTNQPPPPPPEKVIKQANIVEVQDAEEIKDEVKIDFDMDISEDDIFAALDVVEIEKPEEEVADEIFSIVEDKPTPKGGMSTFLKGIHEKLVYPPAALRAKVQGKVFIQFVINADGQLADFQVIKGIGMGCDEEALRVLKQSAAWNPGKQRGVPVRVRMVLPIQFLFRER